MKHLFIFLFSMFVSFKSIGQGHDTTYLMKRATLKVINDITSFSEIDKFTSLDSFMSHYLSETINQYGFLETIFFRVVPECNQCDKCEFIIAYSKSQKRFFKLKGFTTNDFTEFFNFVIWNGEFVDESIENPKKLLKWISKNNIFIEGYDLSESFDVYYNNDKNQLYDKSSCYRKQIITFR